MGLRDMSLSTASREEFLRRGYIKLEGAVPPEFITEATGSLWQRLGYVESDPSTWAETKVHMPTQREWHVANVARVVLQAMEEVVGAGRLALPVQWDDGFVVNLGVGGDRAWAGLSTAQGGWHKDGDFFRHFLDSPEQALLVLVLYTDVVHRGGPTVFLPESVGAVARYLAARPAGCLPKQFDYAGIVGECSEVVEATGRAGDVYLIHPFMVHAESQNTLRVPRVIANPGNSLFEPMNFDRSDGRYSLVEEGVLRALEVKRLSFQASGARHQVVPDRIAQHAKRKALEDARLYGGGAP